MKTEARVVFQTKRLVIRKATIDDAPMLHQLWRDPRVMTNVGYPFGLRITLEAVRQGINGYDDKDPFGQYLIILLKDNQEAIGECKMMRPDEEGISRTDIKLLPDFWGNHFGVEIKEALVDFLFTNTDCDVVEGTPNVKNEPSIKMQQAVGAVCIGEDIFRFPESMSAYTNPVHHFIYHVFRADWDSKRRLGDSDQLT